MCVSYVCCLFTTVCIKSDREGMAEWGSTLNMRIMNFCKHKKKREDKERLVSGLCWGWGGSNSKLRLLYGAMRENLDQLSQRLTLAYTAPHRISTSCAPPSYLAQFVKSLQFQKTLKSLQTQQLPTTCVAMRKIWKVFSFFFISVLYLYCTKSQGDCGLVSVWKHHYNY